MNDSLAVCLSISNLSTRPILQRKLKMIATALSAPNAVEGYGYPLGLTPTLPLAYFQKSSVSMKVKKHKGDGSPAINITGAEGRHSSDSSRGSTKKAVSVRVTHQISHLSDILSANSIQRQTFSFADE